VNLRAATPGDIEAIARLHAVSWRVAYRGMFSDAYLDGDVLADRLATWTERLAHPAANQFVVVAEHAGDLTGFACAYADDDPDWGTLLDNIHVRPGIKRRGAGTRLLAEVARWAHRLHPASGLYLWVLADNVPAQRFYERWGARNAETQQFEPPGGGSVTSHRYVWSDLAAIARIDGGASRPPS
jgi:GNAT superfamily N-acetyltransferase